MVSVSAAYAEAEHKPIGDIRVSLPAVNMLDFLREQSSDREGLLVTPDYKRLDFPATQIKDSTSPFVSITSYLGSTSILDTTRFNLNVDFHMRPDVRLGNREAAILSERLKNMGYQNALEVMNNGNRKLVISGPRAYQLILGVDPDAGSAQNTQQTISFVAQTSVNSSLTPLPDMTFQNQAASAVEDVARTLTSLCGGDFQGTIDWRMGDAHGNAGTATEEQALTLEQAKEFDYKSFVLDLPGWIKEIYKSDGTKDGFEQAEAMRHVERSLQSIDILLGNGFSAPKLYYSIFYAAERFASGDINNVNSENRTKLHKMMGRLITKNIEPLSQYILSGHHGDLAGLTSYIDECPKIISLLEQRADYILRAELPRLGSESLYETQKLQLLIALADYCQGDVKKSASQTLRKLVPASIADVVETSSYKKRSDSLVYLQKLFECDRYVHLSSSKDTPRVVKEILTKFYEMIGVDYKKLSDEILVSSKPNKRHGAVLQALSDCIPIYKDDKDRYRELFSSTRFISSQFWAKLEEDKMLSGTLFALENLGFSIHDSLSIVSKLEVRYFKNIKQTKSWSVHDVILNKLTTTGKALNSTRPGIVVRLYKKYGMLDFENLDLETLDYLDANTDSGNNNVLISRTQDADRHVSESAKEVLAYIAMGLDRNMAFDIAEWSQKVHSRIDIQERMRRLNITRCRELYKVDPNAPMALYDVYGIRDFGRYSVELLEHLYQNMGDMESPSICVAVPQGDDGKDGMAFIGDTDLLYQSVMRTGTHVLRVIEGATKAEIVKRVLALDSRHNTDGSNQIQHLVLTGHGRPGRIYINNNIYWSTDDFRLGGIFAQVYSVLHNRASILINACFGGVNGGVADVVRETSGLQIIAADHAVRVSGIKLVPGDESRSRDSHLDMEINSKGKVIYLGIPESVAL